jgi:hypothetical protein
VDAALDGRHLGPPERVRVTQPLVLSHYQEDRG